MPLQFPPFVLPVAGLVLSLLAVAYHLRFRRHDIVCSDEEDEHTDEVNDHKRKVKQNTALLSVSLIGLSVLSLFEGLFLFEGVCFALCQRCIGRPDGDCLCMRFG